ncbi:hypothetical protein [Haladaptatus cibarius]|uniref:hypothetical protein n=1 Tax=Haladaptatus cibarius TaxID=453847 RepID=UPI001E4EEE37|nr:hypothetical protein [Haladaptatus cibarius]
MSEKSAQTSLHDVGYRRSILALGACWGAAPALSYGWNSLSLLSSSHEMVAVGTLMMLSLGVVYELDSRTLDRHGSGVPLAWSYALVVPISVVGWEIFGPLLGRTPFGLLGILVGAPASALLYVWQRGRCASVSEPDSK